MPRVIAPVLISAALGFAQSTGSVEGAVVDRVTGAAVPGGVVTIYTRQAILYEATSDASGAFQIFGMMPGDYEIRFEKEGYDPFPTEIPPQTLGLKEVKGLTSQGQPRTPATQLAMCSRNWTEAVIESLRPT